jgi:ribosomal protein L24
MRGHKLRRLAPAINELVFVYATSSAINDFKLSSKETVYWLTKPCGERREKIIVPDKQMDDFIRITQQAEQSVTYFRPEELNLSKGDHILIHGGPFDGVEGILMKVKGKRDKQLIVSIPDIAAAAVSIRPDIVELKSPHVTPSSDSQHDARELIRLSSQMLTAAPDRITQEHEYNMLHNEITRLYNSLLSLKGYLPSLEGQISLSLLLAERTFGSVTDTTLHRCQAAISRLRPSKLRDQLLEELTSWQDFNG